LDKLIVNRSLTKIFALQEMKRLIAWMGCQQLPHQALCTARQE